MKRYYFDTDLRGDPKPVEHAEGGLVYYVDAQARIAELTAEVERLKALVKDAYEEGVSDTDRAETGDWENSIARNALKEGK